MTLYANGEITAKSLCPITTSRIPIPLAISIYSIRLDMELDSPLLILPLEFKCWHPFYICLDAEQATRERILPQCGFLQAFTRRRDVEFVQVFSAKDTRGNVLRRDWNLFQQLTCARIPLCNLRSAPHRNPQIPLHIRGHAVGPAQSFGDAYGHAWVRDAAGFQIIIKCFDLTCGRVDIVKGFIVRTPGEAVGDGHIAQ